MPSHEPVIRLEVRLAHLREQFDEAVRSWLQGAREIALLDFPNHDNVGDSLIWLGVRDSLDRLGVRVAYAADEKYTTLAHIRRLEGIPVVFNGGGNFGDLWTATHASRLDLIGSLHAHRVLVLPQSVHFASHGADRQTRAVLAAHPDVTLFVRDEPSLAWASDAGVRTALVPDAALAVDPRRVPQTTAGGAGGAVAVWRTDKEVGGTAGLGPAPAALTRVDWPVERDDVRRLLRALLRLHRLPGGGWALSRRAVLVACDAMAARELRRGLALLGDAPVLVTDRLHATVLGLMSGRTVCRVDNSYGKLGNVLDLWWPGDPTMATAATRHEAEEWAAQPAVRGGSRG